MSIIEFNHFQELSDCGDLAKVSQQSDVLFKILIEQAPIGITILQNRKLLYFNSFAMELFGYQDAREVMDKDLLDFFPQRFHSELQDRHIRRLRGKPVPTTYDTFAVRKDGTEFPVNVVVSNISLNGSPATIQYFKEIHERKRAEDALRESHERFHAIADYSYDWESWIGPDGKAVWTSPSVFRLTGYTLEEYRGIADAPYFLFNENDRERISKIRQAALQGESANNVEVQIYCKDGSRKWVEASYQPIYGSNGANLGFRISVRDIAKRKQVEEALIQLQAELQKRVEEQTRKLTAANDTLRALMNSKEDDQKAMQDKLKVNINDLVIPYLKKLKKSGLNDFQEKCLSELENNLSDVLSPFLTNFLSSHQSLTAQEIQIADLIRRGKRTKEIADILNASANTIATHRNNIRKKLNLRNAKINLRSHLQSLS